MQLAWIDWIIIIAYFVVSLGVGLYFRGRAGKSLEQYFISGRSFPWWVAGTSMVATTFAADTPLAVTGLVAKYGLAGNWFWWSMALGGMFTVFVYSRLWRRAEVLTDVELIELRYGGRPAAFLRGFRSIYLALPINCIIIGWVTGAMLKVLKFTILDSDDANDWMIILICLAVVGIYSTLSGLWGVAITDLIQFVLAMGGCVALAAIAVHDVGGIGPMQQKVAETFGSETQAFRFLPDFTQAGGWMTLNLFLVYLFVLWWASWYPGAEPGGGGYIVQRMSSCKDEKHSLLATLWFQVAHYCVRPWPWLLIAFVALVKFPELRTAEDPGVGFPMVMKEFLPVGLRGLMLVAFFAAFMSTLSTQINWGASYLVSDFYKRFISPTASNAQLALASRAATVLVLVAGGLTAWFMRKVSVDDAWKFLAALGAGTGAVFMLRWFWWRISAWSEIAAMVSSVIYFILVRIFVKTPEYQTALVAGLTVVTWLVVTYLMPPEPMAVLERFYRKVHPGGPGWEPVAAKARDVQPDRSLGVSILCAFLGAGVVYLTLPGIGLLLFGKEIPALLCFAGAAACLYIIFYLLNRIGWEKVAR